MKLQILILLIPILAFGQSNSNFDELIDKTNYYFKQYSKLEEHSNKLPISSFGLSKLEIQEIINSVDDDYSLSPNKDSVDVYLMTTFFQEKIKNQINQLVKQPDFKNKIIRNLIKYE